MEQLTHRLLAIALEYKQPVTLITKNALILRDLDLLKALAEQRLVQVAISFTTMNEPLRRVLEPRTSSGAERLRTMERLALAKVPVMAMIAPIIPALPPTLVRSVRATRCFARTAQCSPSSKHGCNIISRTGPKRSWHKRARCTVANPMIAYTVDGCVALEPSPRIFHAFFECSANDTSSIGACHRWTVLPSSHPLAVNWICSSKWPIGKLGV